MSAAEKPASDGWLGDWDGGLFEHVPVVLILRYMVGCISLMLLFIDDALWLYVADPKLIIPNPSPNLKSLVFSKYQTWSEDSFWIERSEAVTSEYLDIDQQSHERVVFQND